MFWLLRLLVVGYLAGYLAFSIKKEKASDQEKLIIGVMGSVVGHFLFGLIGLGSFSLVGEVLIATGGTYLYLQYFRK